MQRPAEILHRVQRDNRDQPQGAIHVDDRAVHTYRPLDVRVPLR